MNIDRDQLKEVLTEVLQSGRSIDDKTHKTHHKFVEDLIIRAEKREKKRQKFELSFIGAMAVSFAGFMVWIGMLVLDALSQVNHP